MLLSSWFGKRGGARLSYVIDCYLISVIMGWWKLELIAVGVIIVLFLFAKLYQDYLLGVRWIIYGILVCGLPYVGTLYKEFESAAQVWAMMIFLANMLYLRIEYDSDIKDISKKISKKDEVVFKDDSPR